MFVLEFIGMHFIIFFILSALLCAAMYFGDHVLDLVLRIPEAIEAKRKRKQSK